MISRELLSLVLGINAEISIYNDFNKHPNEVLIYDNIDTKDTDSINLDTLGRLCKEFILKHHQIMGSYSSTSVQGWCVWIDDLGNKGIAKTELEAVIKATEWVAREKGLI